jgi:hypothetical protein
MITKRNIYAAIVAPEALPEKKATPSDLLSMKIGWHIWSMLSDVEE